MLFKSVSVIIFNILLVHTFSVYGLENEYIPSVFSSPLDKEKIEVLWYHPLNESVWQSDVQGFVVSYVRNDKLRTEPFTSVTVPREQLMYIIGGLQPGTRYEIMVSVIVVTTEGSVRYNSSLHQQKTLGFGPDFGCEHCDIMHTKDVICDPDTAVCNCKDDLRGGTCAECVPGAVMILMHCQLCNCDLIGSDGNCTADAEDETKKVFCHCHPGYHGRMCELDIAMVNDTTTTVEPKAESEMTVFSRVVAGIIVAIILLALLIGALYVLRQKVRQARLQEASKWLATAPFNDYAHLADSMEPTATSDGDVSFDGRKPQLHLQSAHNNNEHA